MLSLTPPTLSPVPLPYRPSNSVILPTMTHQPQPLVSITPPTTRYGASSFRFNDFAQAKPGQSPYFETDRIKALAVYAESGNQHEASRQTGIPQETIRNWVNNEDSSGLVQELRSTLRYNRGWQLAKLSGKVLDQLEIALDEGDPVVLKDGRIINKRASARDLVVTASILIDKWMLISGAISNETMLLGRMNELSQQLASMGTSLAKPSPDPPPNGTPIQDTQGENLIG